MSTGLSSFRRGLLFCNLSPEAISHTNRSLLLVSTAATLWGSAVFSALEWGPWSTPSGGSSSLDLSQIGVMVGTILGLVLFVSAVISTSRALTLSPVQVRP